LVQRNRYAQTATPTRRTKSGPADNPALKRRGLPKIWFDPGMTRVNAPGGRRGRQQISSDAAIQTCLSIKVLLGIALTSPDVAAFGSAPDSAAWRGLAPRAVIRLRERRALAGLQSR